MFELQGAGWVEVARLVASDGKAGDQFGVDVAISGDHILVGAPLSDTFGPRSGSAYAYEFSNGAWSETQVLFSGSPFTEDRYGRAVALSADCAMVGAPTNLSPQGDGTGSVFAYELVGSTWVETLAFENGLLTLGGGIDMEGDRAGVTALGNTLIFDRSGSNWILTHVVSTSTSAIVELQGDRFFTAQAPVSPSLISSYRFDGEEWIAHGAMVPDGSTSGSLGASIAAVGDELLAGAPGSTPTGPAAGKVQVFDTSLPVTYCTAKVNSLGCVPKISAEFQPSVSIGSFEIHASEVHNLKNGLLFFGTARANVPFLGGTLCVQPPLARAQVQSSGGSGLQFPPDCSGSYEFRIVPYLIQVGLAVPGSTFNAQYWSRDQEAAFGVGLTNALEFYLCP